MLIEASDTTLDAPAILRNVRALAGVLREEADENERLRRLTPLAVDALRSTGVFRMPMPRAWGGPEVDPLTQLEIIEELSRADGSTGWCAMIGSDGGYYSAALTDEAGRALYPQLDAVTAGWVQPGGRLEPAGDGYRLSGHWRFGSGCTHADVIVAGATVWADGAPVLDAHAEPEWRIALLPASGVEILDTWNTTGLAGTGSHDYRVDDAFVPLDHTFRFGDRHRDGALYAWPGLFAVNLLAAPLGVGRAAIDTAERLLEDKVLMPELRPARDDPRVRTAIAQAEALLGSARSYAYDVVGEFWESLWSGDEPERRQRAALAGSYGHTVRSCREAVELLAEAVGSDAIFRDSPIERHRRDLATMAHHILAQLKLLGIVGGLWIDGSDTDHRLLRQRLL
jgi:alkylation response protein AidB-like acyl-CoA dehydrogenase